jgi:hypothetical protein
VRIFTLPSLISFLKSNPPSLKKREGVVYRFDLKASIIIIFSCLLNSPPLKGGVDSVSPKETGDEVVFAWVRLLNPNYALENLLRLKTTAKSSVSLCFLI